MGITATFIKFNSTKLIPIIHQYYSRILEHGIIPQNWKLNFIVPIPKKGSKLDVSNYRGIALQSVLPKIFDKLLTLKLQNHMTSVIPQSQHGFTAKKGTQTNLLEITQFISENSSKGNQIDVIYFDFSKAFDVIDHSILASKLAKFSMPFSLFWTTMNFVIGRKYQMKIDGIPTNHQFEIFSSVPQGSHVGPFLFNIMTSDILECTIDSNNQQLLYADDTKFFGIVNNITEQLHLQHSIDKLKEWSTRNKIELNNNKTFVVSYTTKKRERFNSRYYILNNVISKVESIKDLGVTFDSHLTFNNHIDNLVTKASRITAMSYKFTKEINMPTLNMRLIKTYLLPILEYCSVIWYPTRNKHIKELEISIRYATRTHLKSPYRNDHQDYLSYDERLDELQILNLEERRNIALLTTACKLIRNEILSTLSQTLHGHINQNTRNRNPNIFQYSNSMTSSPLKLMMACANKFSARISIYDSPESIRNTVKKFYLDQRSAAIPIR